METKTPKVNYEKGKRKESMVSPALLQTDQKVVTPNIRDLIFAAARAYGVTPLGITLLGSGGKLRAYINEMGLNDKLSQDSRKVHKIDQKILKEATKKDPTAQAQTTITMFNYKVFAEVTKQWLQAGKEPTKAIVEILKDACMDTYTGIGFASGNSCKGIAYHYIYDQKAGKKIADLQNPILDNINMIALTRSSNRCKRHIAKVGGTSAEEMSGVEEGITLEKEGYKVEEEVKKTEHEKEKVQQKNLFKEE